MIFKVLQYCTTRIDLVGFILVLLFRTIIHVKACWNRLRAATGPHARDDPEKRGWVLADINMELMRASHLDYQGASVRACPKCEEWNPEP